MSPGEYGPRTKWRWDAPSSITTWRATSHVQPILAANNNNNNNIQGVFGVNDSMALGAVDVLKANNMIGKVVVFGDDREADARWAADDGSTSPMSGLAT